MRYCVSRKAKGFPSANLLCKCRLIPVGNRPQNLSILLPVNLAPLNVMGRSNNPAVQSNSGVKKQKWGRVFPPLFLKGQEMRPLPFQKQKNSRPITIQDGRKPANMAQEITSKYLPGVYIGKGPGEEGYALPPRRHALQFYHGGAGRFPSVLFLLRLRSINTAEPLFLFRRPSSTCGTKGFLI